MSKNNITIATNVAESCIERFSKDIIHANLYIQEFNEDGSVSVMRSPFGDILFEIIYEEVKKELEND